MVGKLTNMAINKERDFQSKFCKWIKENKIPGLFELKISHGNTVSWGKFESQQLPSLWKCYTEGLYHKESDLGSISLKPADCWFMKQDAFVGIMFNIPDNQNVFYLIHIKEVMKLREKQKSITKKDCETLAIKHSF